MSRSPLIVPHPVSRMWAFSCFFSQWPLSQMPAYSTMTDIRKTRPGTVSMPQFFKQNGYWTAGLVKYSTTQERSWRHSLARKHALKMTNSSCPRHAWSSKQSTARSTNSQTRKNGRKPKASIRETECAKLHPAKEEAVYGMTSTKTAKMPDRSSSGLRTKVTETNPFSFHWDYKNHMFISRPWQIFWSLSIR